MPILIKLATSLGRKDEVPNVKLAIEIAEAGSTVAVEELVAILANGEEDIRLRYDSLKCLYEVGERKPALIANHADVFAALLGSKQNRLVWGGMCALDALCLENPEAVFSQLDAVIAAINKGSVITKDHGVSLLSKLGSLDVFRPVVFPHLIEELQRCPPKQIPQYAEKGLKALDDQTRGIYSDVLERRFPELERDSQRKRVEKVLKRIESG